MVLCIVPIINVITPLFKLILQEWLTQVSNNRSSIHACAQRRLAVVHVGGEQVLLFRRVFSLIRLALAEAGTSNQPNSVL